MEALKPIYTVVAERSQGWWAIHVPELPGVFTQARRLDAVEPTARDAISLFLDVPANAFDLRSVEVLDASTQKAIDESLATRAAATASQQTAADRTREAAQALQRQGLPQRDIGRLLKLSHQRVAQLLGAKGG